MLKDLIFALLHPFLRLYVRLRFGGDYWALKEALERRPNRLLRLCYEHHFMKLGSYIGLGSVVKGRPYFPHRCVGVFISKDAVIGRDAVIFQQVTIGSNDLPGSKGRGAPVIGDGVYIGAGAKIIGGVIVGDHCRIGANAVVYTDLPPHSVAVCSPTRILQRENLDTAFHTVINGVPYVSCNGRLAPEEGPPTGSREPAEV